MPTDQETQKDRWTIFVCNTCKGVGWRFRDKFQPCQPEAHTHAGAHSGPIEVCRVSELETEKERADYWHDLLTRMEDTAREKAQKAEQRLDEVETSHDLLADDVIRERDRAEAAEKALKETLDLLRGIALDSSDPASRACATHWLATHNDNEEDPNA